MALGGGTFTAYDKILPGAYMNFISRSSASVALSDRGIATMPLLRSWGASNEVVTVTREDFQKNSLKLFGYHYSHSTNIELREFFKNAHTLLVYRLNGDTENGAGYASNVYAKAKYPGTRGNDIKIVVQPNVDESGSKYDVMTYLDGIVVDKQIVSGAAQLVENDFVSFNKGTTLTETSGTPLTGGKNSTVNVGSYQKYFDAIEAYSFNTMGIEVVNASVVALAVAYTKRLRDELGKKFQTVLVAGDSSPNYEGIINVDGTLSTTDLIGYNLIPWITGAVAGCSINKSLTNKVYDGEIKISRGSFDETQNELETLIQNGKFTFHIVGSEIRVLEDINSLTTTTEEKGEIFKDNQTIRTIDQIANDTAVLFNTKYLGNIPNDEAGRTSLWADIVKHHEALQNTRVIENFDAKDVTIEQGADKKSIVIHDAVTPVGTMTKLYSTTVIR